jgi:hypothetical protein
MASKKTQYVVIPAAGMVASEANPQQIQFFEALHQTASSANKVRSMSTHIGMLPIKVLDSIGEKKAKLIECVPEDLPALRASHPSVRILPVVYFRRAVMRYTIDNQFGVSAVRAKAKTAAKPSTIAITITSSTDAKPVANALVVGRLVKQQIREQSAGKIARGNREIVRGKPREQTGRDLC